MPYIIAFANQKGGVGKTTSAVNIAACTAALGKRVLLVDADPQGNATSACGINKRDVHISVYDAIIGQADTARAVIKTKYDNLSVLPSTISLAGAEFDLIGMDEREKAFRRMLAPIADGYDVIMIDCPPSLGLLTVNALSRADGKRSFRCGRRGHSHAVRILRARGAFPAHDNHRAYTSEVQPPTERHGNTHHDVQRQAESFDAGHGRAEEVLRGQAVFDGHYAECSPDRSAELRDSGVLLRQVFKRKSGIP